MNLQFNGDTFVIAQLTDIHFKDWKNGQPIWSFDVQSVKLIEQLLKEHPVDMLAITGDTVDSPFMEYPSQSHQEMLKWFDSLNVPYFMTFGNHDSEKGTSRQELLDNLAQYGSNQVPKEHLSIIGNRENFLVPIYQGDEVYAYIFVMDSGDYVDVNDNKTTEYLEHHPEVKDSVYAYILEEQEQWLKAVNEQLKPSLSKEDILFMHIPFNEYQACKDYVIEGDFLEEVCCATYPSTIFSVIKHHTNIQYVSVGHDHDNTFWALYEGINLCYGQPTGFGSYGKLDRGIRYFSFMQSQPLETYRLTKSFR